MIKCLIEIAIGWFVFEKLPELVNASRTLSSLIKIVGVVICIAGGIGLLRSLGSLF